MGVKEGLLQGPSGLLGLLWGEGIGSGGVEKKLELIGSIKGLVRGLLGPLLP